MQNYQTKAGDTWDGIAFLMYGQENMASVLMKANQEHIKTAIFSGNITLNIPLITLDKKVENLPPWKVKQ